MKKISIMFAAALSLAAFTGCKKKGGGDCASTISTSIDRGMKDEKDGMKNLPEDQRKAAEAMLPKMKDAMTKACIDDKWSPEMLKCLDDAKTEADAKMCEGKLTPEQTANMGKAMMAAMDPSAMMGAMGSAMGSGMAGSGSAAMAGSGSAMAGSAMDGSGSAAMAGSGSAAMAGSGAAPAAGAAGLPPECADYKAMVDKMASCDKMDKSMKDALKSSYDTMAQSMSGAGATPEAMAAMAPACKAGADALKQAAGALCGW